MRAIPFFQMDNRTSQMNFNNGRMGNRLSRMGNNWGLYLNVACLGDTFGHVQRTPLSEESSLVEEMSMLQLIEEWCRAGPTHSKGQIDVRGRMCKYGVALHIS